MPTRTRRPTAERRSEIAQTALRIIGERGLPSLTTATLAAEIGVTSGALFRHFISRDAILAESVRYAVERIEATFPDATLPPTDRIFHLARNRVRVLGSDRGLAWLLRSDQAYLTMPEGAVVELRALVVRTRKYLLDAIRQGGVDGTIRSDIEPEVLVLTVTGTIHALIGLTGLHRHATSTRGPDHERVISGLARLISPPAVPVTSRQRQKPRGRTRRKT